jgi:hypothetical protein
MHHIEQLSKNKTIPARIRFLLQDVIDLRSRGWSTDPIFKPNHRITIASPADIKFIKCWGKGETTNAKATAEKPSKNVKRAETMPVSVKETKKATETKVTAVPVSKKVEAVKKGEEPISTEDVIQILARLHRNCASSLSKVAQGGDIAVAVAKLFSLPAQFRSCEWANMVSRVAEDASETSRNNMWSLLFKLTEQWRQEGFDINEAVQNFKEDTYNDLLLDIPEVPVIMSNELRPLLHRLQCSTTFEQLNL